MRQVIDPQLKFGEQDISAIELDPKSRDDIPRILRGLQYIYTTAELREEVFAILAEVLPAGADGEVKGPGSINSKKKTLLANVRQCDSYPADARAAPHTG